MELKLAEGKYTLGPCREPSEADEIEEVLQRIYMKLKVRRGAFIPLPEYGSRLYLLAQTKPSERQSAARQYVLEAIADETLVELTELELISESDGAGRLLLSFTYKGEYTVKLETAI